MFDSASLQLVYRPDLDVFTVRWLTNSAFATLRDEYEAVLLADEAHRTCRWLFDVRRRPTTTAEATEWVTTHWLPRAAAVTQPGRLRLAYLVAPARAEALRLDTRLRVLMEAALTSNHPYDLQTFGDEGAAMRWLLA